MPWQVNLAFTAHLMKAQGPQVAPTAAHEAEVPNCLQVKGKAIAFKRLGAI